MDYIAQAARAAAQMASVQAHIDGMSPPEVSDEVEDIDWLITESVEMLGRAERALRDGNYSAARDLLLSAGKGIVEALS